MAHLSKRLLAITVLAVLAAVMSVEANDKKVNHKWCVARPGTNNNTLQQIINDLCRDLDCSYIQKNGRCYHPNNYRHHASWGMNEHYHKNGEKDCYFKGHGMVVHKYPQGNGGCEVHPNDRKPNGGKQNPHKNSWCVAKNHLSHNELQQIIDQLCGKSGHVVCTKTKPGNACYKPNSGWDHASWAMNEYYQSNGRKASDCNFNGRGRVTYKSPGSEKCYPTLDVQKRRTQEL